MDEAQCTGYEPRGWIRSGAREKMGTERCGSLTELLLAFQLSTSPRRWPSAQYSRKMYILLTLHQLHKNTPRYQSHPHPCAHLPVRLSRQVEGRALHAIKPEALQASAPIRGRGILLSVVAHDVLVLKLGQDCDLALRLLKLRLHRSSRSVTGPAPRATPSATLPRWLAYLFVRGPASIARNLLHRNKVHALPELRAIHRAEGSHPELHACHRSLFRTRRRRCSQACAPARP